VISQTAIIQIHALHKEAVGTANNYFKEEFRLLDVLQRIDKCKGHRFLGFKNLHQYATVALKLSRDQAYNFVYVARKAAQIDRLHTALMNKEITLSKAKKIGSVISEENAEKWIDCAKRLSQKSLEGVVAKINPRSVIQEGTRFIADNTFELRVAISSQTEFRLKRVQDIICQKERRAVSFEETLQAMATLYIGKNDPVVKAAKVLKKNSSLRRKNLNDQVVNKSPTKRIPLTAELKHNLYQRDQGKCQKIDPHSPNGKCSDGRWIDFHHRIPVYQGGSNTLENLVTLCRAHHQMGHLSSSDETSDI
jgi:5-methylcytosine-specific restriction endonuclease McrA